MADKSKDIDFGAEASGSVAGTVMLITEATLKAEHEWLEPSEVGLIGTNRPANTGRILAKTDVRGDVVVEPSYANANLILQQVFDETTGTFTPADAPEDIDVGDIVLDRKSDVYTYADCWPSQLELSASENEAVKWRLGLLGKLEADAGTVAALAIPDRMRMADLSVSLNSNVYFPTRFSWLFDYDYVERFAQSVSRSSIMSRIPKCTLELDLDLNADTWTDLFDNAGTDTALADVVLTFTDGSNTVTITMQETAIMNASKPPDISGIDEVSGTLELRSWLKSGQTDIVIITYA